MIVPNDWRPLDTPAKRYLYGSWGFVRAAQLIHEAHPDAWPACFVNVDFSIELALKAFLSAKGDTREGLKGIGHKLSQLYERAAERGYEVGHPGIPDYINALHQTHVDMSLRYLEGGPVIDLPPIPSVIGVALQLIQDVRSQAAIWG